ncbi:hypothetical protein [Sphingomonas phyllosphaerae]|uniref:hypothetical protein n=1 Tax=Sphingomonas phyllosphaerae TaxID=257003 RepID=UPI002413438B|nr:hypothetical protein [Sphingomonas phyllosphaerae]
MRTTLLAAAALSFFTTPANAALVAYNVRINGASLTMEGIAAPVSGLLVDFDVRFDDTVLKIDRTQEGLTVNSSNFGWNHPLYYA